MAKVGFRKECFVIYLEMKRPWDFFFVFCVFQFFRDTKTCLDVYFSYDTKIEAWVREATISYPEFRRRPRFGFVIGARIWDGRVNSSYNLFTF